MVHLYEHFAYSNQITHFCNTFSLILYYLIFRSINYSKLTKQRLGINMLGGLNLEDYTRYFFLKYEIKNREEVVQQNRIMVPE